jgi:hypothetical protein
MAASLPTGETGLLQFAGDELRSTSSKICKSKTQIVGFSVAVIITTDINLLYLYILHKCNTTCPGRFSVIAVMGKGQISVLHINLLKTKRNLLYTSNQSVPRSKHFPPWL